MAGTRAGGRKSAIKNKERHGADFYARIGRRGGRNSKTGGFASNKIGKDGLTGPERAKLVGSIGGAKSKRGPAIKVSAKDIERAKQEIDEADIEQLKEQIKLLNLRLSRLQNGN